MQTVILDKNLHEEVYGMAVNRVSEMAIIKSRQGIHEVIKVSREGLDLFQVLYLEVPEEVQADSGIYSIESFVNCKGTKTRIADFLGKSLSPQMNDLQIIKKAESIVQKMARSVELVDSVNKYSEALDLISMRIRDLGDDVNPQDTIRFFF